MPIAFHNADVKFFLKQKKELKAFIKQQTTDNKQQIKNLSFIFCSDEYLLKINRQFLNHDYYTDIITFPLGESKERIEADIYISIDRVRENGLKFAVRGSQKIPKSNLQCTHELHRVVFHGVLHLLGYKDKTKAQKAEMRKMEDKWLNKFEESIN